MNWSVIICIQSSNFEEWKICNSRGLNSHQPWQLDIEKHHQPPPSSHVFEMLSPSLNISPPIVSSTSITAIWQESLMNILVDRWGHLPHHPVSLRWLQQPEMEHHQLDNNRLEVSLISTFNSILLSISWLTHTCDTTCLFRVYKEKEREKKKKRDKCRV